MTLKAQKLNNEKKRKPIMYYVIVLVQFRHMFTDTLHEE